MVLGRNTEAEAPEAKHKSVRVAIEVAAFMVIVRMVYLAMGWSVGEDNSSSVANHGQLRQL